MPKVIDNIFENALKISKEIILESGYKALNIRTVAARCKIAVGTVYNYFPSKDHLIANVMLEDWNRMLDRIETETEKTGDIISGFEIIFNEIKAFSEIYVKVWNEYSNPAGAMDKTRHAMLVAGIAKPVKKLMERFNVEESGNRIKLSDFISETLLSKAYMFESEYGELEHILKKLIA